MHQSPIAVSVPEATRLTGISRSRLYRLVKEGRLSPRKAGKTTLFLVEDLRRYVESLPAAS